ncbi:MAG TPA: FKBP-type peptidyl-prolyl cis-trans isomerase [Vicinamibacterales bacterium]|nr:FKBP-type peptidyl-prolyl cis-trans isomerase [Vicinamibacterales bacterium]
MTRLLFVAASVAAALLGAGCASPALPTGTSIGATFSQTDLIVGTGTAAANSNTLGVTYVGWLFDPLQPQSQGAQFDASTSTFTFTLGSGQVIAGWDQGLVGMKVGGTRRLVIPPSLGYGDVRHGPIPPNSTLIFDIVLVSVQ